jgi:hypothetical protein
MDRLKELKRIIEEEEERLRAAVRPLWSRLNAWKADALPARPGS